MRPRPVYPEFVSHASWWPVQEWQKNGDPDTIFLWIPKADNRNYERTIPRRRFCPNYHRPQKYCKVNGSKVTVPSC